MSNYVEVKPGVLKSSKFVSSLKGQKIEEKRKKTVVVGFGKKESGIIDTRKQVNLTNTSVGRAIAQHSAQNQGKNISYNVIIFIYI